MGRFAYHLPLVDLAILRVVQYTTARCIRVNSFGLVKLLSRHTGLTRSYP